jgi:hypothetical protein
MEKIGARNAADLVRIVLSSGPHAVARDGDIAASI